MLLGQWDLLRPWSAVVVGDSPVDDRVQPADELAHSGAVERRLERAGHSVHRNVLDVGRRDLDPDSPHHVVEVAIDENAQGRPRTVRLAGVVRLADIGDERIGIEAVELVLVQATVGQVRWTLVGWSRLGTGDLTRRVEQSSSCIRQNMGAKALRGTSPCRASDPGRTGRLHGMDAAAEAGIAEAFDRIEDFVAVQGSEISVERRQNRLQRIGRERRRGLARPSATGSKTLDARFRAGRSCSE